MNTGIRFWFILVLASSIHALAPLPAYGTAQESDLLVLNGKEREILTNPLETFLREHPEKRPSSDVQLTSLWRGYIAVWNIDDDRLSLVDVAVRRIRVGDEDSWLMETESVLSAVFPGQDSVPATWYTGYLIVPDGKRIEYVHMGYGSLYKRYIVLTVRKGTVTQREQLKARGFREFREKQFESFKETVEYRDELAKLQDGRDRSREELEDFLFDYLSEQYTNMIFDSESERRP